MIPSTLLKDPARKAISEICYDELAALTPLINKLHILDIDNVDARFLPFLASWFRVEYWDESLSTDLKRQKVKEALAVFRLLGTPEAVDQTLDFLASAYGVSLTLREWFEMTPEGQRGTFEVLLDTVRKGAVLDEDMYKRIEAGVERNKRKSQHWGLRVESETKGDVILAGGMRASETVALMPELELIGIGVNDWLTSDFSPTTSFSGAVYSLAIQGGIGALTYEVTEGNATVNNAGDVTITGPGAITVTASDKYGRTVEHGIFPTLWFTRSDDFFPAIGEQIEAWIASMNGRMPTLEEVSPCMPYLTRKMGTLNNEWGDLAAFGWPHDSNIEAADSNKYALSLTNNGETREYAWLCGGHAGNCGDTSSNLYINGLCVIDYPEALKERSVNGK